MCKGFSYRDSDGYCQLKSGSLATGFTLQLSTLDWYEPDPILSDLTVNMIPQRFYGCLWAETKGKVMLSKRIDVEVCGTEEL